MEKLSGYNNIVTFTWHSNKNIELIEPLLNYLADQCQCEYSVVTSDATGKVNLLNRGHDAFTVNEILMAYAESSSQCAPVEQGRAEQPLDLYLNWLHTPKDPELLDHPPRSTTMDYYEWKRKQLVAAYTQFLEDLGAEAVITWNGALLVTGALAEAASLLGIETFFMERGLLPSSLVIDPQGVNNDSLIAGADWREHAVPMPTDDEIRALSAYCHRMGSSGTSIVNTGQRKEIDAVLSQLELSPEKPVILLPLQIESDSNIQNNSPFFKSMEDLIQAVKSALTGVDAQLVVKPHPEDRVRRDTIEALCNEPSMRCCWDLALQSLLPVTDLVVVINSTVGLEALLQNKPVVALGRSIYDRKGFTADLHNRNELGNVIQQALSKLPHPHDNPEFWWFLNTLMSRHTFFYGEQPGLTDIKPMLSETFVGRNVEPSTKPQPRLQELKAANDSLVDIINGETAGSDRVLVIGPLDTALDDVPCNVSLLNRRAHPLRFLRALLHRHELMVCMEWPSNRLLRCFFAMLRAKRTVILG